MREIKFRGKRMDNREWVYGYYVIDPKGRHRIYWQPFDEATSHTYHFVIPATVGQFTGLKDRNGKEIYEGDIVEFIYWPEGINRRHIGIVSLDQYRNWCLKISEEKIKEFKYSNGRFHIDNAVLYGEVIGNIHDNPELLTNK